MGISNFFSTVQKRNFSCQWASNLISNPSQKCLGLLLTSLLSVGILTFILNSKKKKEKLAANDHLIYNLQIKNGLDLGPLLS